MADLRIRPCGLDLAHPIVLASGPLSHDGAALVRAHRAGVSAVVTKTIRDEAARNPLPHIVGWSGGLLNSERWSDLPATQWIEQEIPRAKAEGVVVIASLGAEPSRVPVLASALVDAGADALEICSYDPSDTTAMVAAATRSVRIPVFAKLSANWPSMTDVAAACLEAGADGITAIDSIGPALRIDIDRRAPRLGDGRGWLSGRSIFPLAVHAVASIAAQTDAPILGTGGVGSADDCLELLMAGATAVGVCSHLMLHGLACVPALVRALSDRLDALGYRRVTEARGAALPALARAAAAPPLAASPGSLATAVFDWNEALCTACRRCVTVCPYQARHDPETVDRGRCRSCGLCASVCGPKALRLRRVEAEGGLS